MGQYAMPNDYPSTGEPIAVCGLSLKFPQDASSEKGFWAMLLGKRNAMTDYPPDRLNVDAFYHPTRYNALRTRGAHFLKEDLGVFDANFFSLTPSEASAMDPMQRILLETTYRALENAGIRMEDVKGSRSSVHTGCFTNDYLQQMLKDSERLPPYGAVGATQSMLANRLSWFYDLRGPSVNLDSACSSSAMAVDLSCQLLHSGVTDMGIVAGCNMLLDPDFSTILSNMQMLSPSGPCYAFDHRANGYSRGEGVAVVVLKRLSDALRDNDTIRAVVRASGSNQDGRTPGITQPDPKAQAQLIRETYQRAGLSMEHTRFFEAHGTGTAIGDPIELGAIADCFHRHRNSIDPLHVGSVKTNIGHLEGASGIAGLIKAILVVESGIIPPNTNFESINRKLAAYDYMISLPSECIMWPPCKIRRASVNSFGYGGTNSHIIIDDAFSYLQRRGLTANFSKASKSHLRGAELERDEKESRIDRPDVAQCLTAVVQIGIVDLLRSFDVRPVAVVGHSMGEIAAAYCAELLTHESALRIAFYRGLFTATLPARSHFKGAMLAVALPSERLSTYFDKIRAGCNALSSLVISCVNSPSNTTVSGEEAAIEELKQILDGEGIFARRLRVPVAYHSPQMDLIVSDCLSNFTGLESPKQDSNIKMVSSVTGSVLNKGRACEASYWTDNMVSPVLFSQAVARLLRDSERALRPKIDGSHRDAIVVDTLVEVGPHAALQLPIQETIKELLRGKDIKYFSTLYRKQSASDTLLRLIGQLHCCGLPVNLRRVNDPDETLQGSRVSLVDAPEYPFDHSRRYWSESPLVHNYRLRKHGHVELLGSPSDWNPLQPQWRCIVRVTDMPWLMDHKLNGRAVYPASAMAVMALQGVSQLIENEKVKGFTLRNIRYEAPIAVTSDSTDLETRLQMKPLKVTTKTQSRRWAFAVQSVTAGHWVENCSGTVEAHFDSASESAGTRERSRFYERCLTERSEKSNKVFDSTAIYDKFARSGFYYGPSFQGITALCHNGTDTVTASLSWSNVLGDSAGSNGNGFVIHPAHLDSFFHLALVSMSGRDNLIPTQAISHINKLWISADGLNLPHVSVHASAILEGETPRTKLYSGFAMAEDNKNARLVLDGLQTTVIASVDEPNESAGHNQFWCGLQTAVDVDTLSGSEVLKRLEVMCGPDHIGPSNFFIDLRHYLYSTVRKLRKTIEASGTDPNKPYLLKYVDWMDWHLSTSVNGSFVTSDSALRQRIATAGFLGEFFLKVADNALDVLQGRSDMVQLIFEDNLVETFYEEFLSHSSYYEKLQAYLEDLSFKHPGMDFLEVGAGTGSFTERILKAVSSSATGTKERFNSYHYTDISPAFFERARKRFYSHSHKMKFGLLNAERDPLGQGFKEKTFDVISASNVLHVTKNLDQTLQGLRKLLKPGGKLLLHEYIHPERIEVGFVFGLLPGWWPDDESRKLGPLASEETWDMLLHRNGLSGADFSLRDFADQESHLMSIICATAVEPEEANGLGVLPDVAIAVEPGSSIQADMAEALISRFATEGRRAVRVDLQDAPEDVASHRVMVTLFDLESAILSRLNKTEFESLKSLLLSASTILWASKGAGPSADPSHGMIDGFARVFRIENINTRLATLALDTNSRSSVEDCSLIISAFKQVTKPTGFDQPEDYIVKDGALCLSRIYENTSFRAVMSEELSGERRIKNKAKDARPFKAVFHDAKTSLSPRVTEDSPLSGPLGSDEIEIHVRAIGLNPVDFSVMSGRSATIEAGRECAGTVTRVGSSCDLAVGDHVCAYGTGVLRSTSRAKQNLVAKVPKSLSFEEASTLPQDYIIANYLVHEARVQHDDLVVVRGGDTRLGRATLDVLQKYGAKLCTSVITAGKENIFFDGVTVLAEDCFAETFKSCFCTGANIVLDFVNTDILQLTECVAKFGSILSIRTADGTYTTIDCFPLPSTVGFRIIDVVEVLLHQAERLQMPFSDLSRTSATWPFPLKTVSIEEVLSSMRALEPEERMVVSYDDEREINRNQDIMYEKMSFQDWKVAIDPKTQGSWNLHEQLPKGMDFFILTSSISGIMGQATQINYAAGNTYQDALAKYRLSIGEKGVSLDLGILATGGLVSQNEGLAGRLAAENVYTVLSEPEILALLDHFCDPNLRIEEIPSQIVTGFINPSLQDPRSSNFPAAFSHPFWSQTLTRRGGVEDSKRDTGGGVVELSRLMAEAGSAAKTSEIVAGALADQISSLVMTPRSNINMEEPLHTAGADSLSAVYLRNWIMKQFAVEVAVFDILGDMSITALGNSITKEWRAARDIK
ncbi:Type I Iterative PKS [Cytospora paraplurivora]|uniref:Type I Iterative PKS n=1 Tax=Cytospora paraplurivora TaxID=2898453 RepID=A0AAN9UHZ8_9PEZI